MRQDLIEWLNGREEKSAGAGLFLAPLGAAPEPAAEPQRSPDPAVQPDPPEEPGESPDLSAEEEREEEQEADLFEEPPAQPEAAQDEPDLLAEPADEPDLSAGEGPDLFAEPERDDETPPEEAAEPEPEQAPRFRPLGSSGEYDSLPDLWSSLGQFEDYEVNRGTLITQKLHSDMQQRKSLAEEQPEPRRRGPRLLPLFLILLLLLLGAGASFLLWRYLRRPEVLAVPVAEEKTAAPRQEGASPRPAELETRPAPPLSSPLEDAIQKGRLALAQGRWDDAILQFAQAIRQRPGDVRPRLGMAGAYRAKGMTFDAVRVLQEALRRFPEDVTVRETLRQLRNPI